jgi:DNA recombination protein RmuC
MDDFYLNFFIGFLTALLFGFGFFWRYYIKKEKESRALYRAYYDVKTKLAVSNEKINSIENTNSQLKEQFENIAHSILEKNSKKMLYENQTSMAQILQPFKENITDFNKKIETYYHDETKERFSLIKEIEKLQILNQKISNEANNLANALKGDNKIQGDWGEYILERVLESSGLKKGREYEIQKEYSSNSGEKLRPDVIVHLPDKKDIIIDSKLSLISYERFHSSKNQLEREEHLVKHLNSIKTHIRQLSNKRYQDIPNINTLDFVLMFIPIEAAFLLAVEKDRTLYERAYEKNIIIVSPSTLLAVLRTIQNSWRYEYQNKNAQLIAKKAGDMHDKFVSFVNQMLDVEKALTKAQSSYEDAFKKLSSGKGNLINRSRELKELDGVYHKKEQTRVLEE